MTLDCWSVSTDIHRAPSVLLKVLISAIIKYEVQLNMSLLVRAMAMRGGRLTLSRRVSRAKKKCYPTYSRLYTRFENPTRCIRLRAGKSNEQMKRELYLMLALPQGTEKVKYFFTSWVDMSITVMRNFCSLSLHDQSYF